MLPNDFKNYSKEISYGKKGANYPLLSNVREVMFIRGSSKMYWKSDFQQRDKGG